MDRKVYLFRTNDNSQELYYSSYGKIGSKENCADLIKEGFHRYGKFFYLKDYEDYKSARKNNSVLIVRG